MAREVLKRTHLHVIIRNRGGDFLYSPEELQRMSYDIDICREMGVDGVVFGCLTADGRIDHNANKTLMAHTGTMNVTFHRAFDRCSHPEQAIDKIFELGLTGYLPLVNSHSCTRNTSVTPIERAISRENRHYGWLRSERREHC